MNIVEWSQKYVSDKNYAPVGPGWKHIILHLCKDIMCLDLKVDVVQVKEKFGGLRFYIDGGNEEINDLIQNAEAESFQTCEECGSKEDVSTSGDWRLTLCKKCREKFKNE